MELDSNVTVTCFIIRIVMKMKILVTLKKPYVHLAPQWIKKFDKDLEKNVHVLMKISFITLSSRQEN